MPKVALITGVTGMVGSHLTDFLLKNTDWKIYGLCRWRSSLHNLHHLTEIINGKRRLQLIYGDIRDPIAVNMVIEKTLPDYVFHLAAQSYPKTSFDAPLDTYETNIQGTETILASIKKFKPNAVVHVCSSSEVFGRVPEEKLPIDEECSFHPASPYAISKIGTDLIGRYYAEAYNMTVMTTRMFTHTGPRRGDVFAESSFAKQIAMIEEGLKEPIIHTGNLDSLRTWADVRDAVRAYFMLVTINPQKGSYYNIGGSYTCSVGEMLNRLVSLSTLSDIKIEVDPERLRPIDADLQVPDTTKFKVHTGWEPTYTFEQTMQDLLDYWRHQVQSGATVINR